jgi:hypothetical protein
MEQQDDEISLIDLLVVLLKHWKLVVAIPLIVAIFAGALYLYRTTITKPVQKTETSISFSVNPLVKQFVGSVNLEGSIVNVYLKDTRLFYDILSQLKMSQLGEFKISSDQDEAFALIKYLLIEGKTPSQNKLSDTKRPLLVTTTYDLITLTVRFNNKEIEQQFIALLVQALNKKINDLIIPIAKKEAQDYEQLLVEGSKTASNLLQNTLAVRYTAYSSALRYLKGEQEPFVLTNPVTITISSLPSKTIILVSIIAALFFAIFLAFVLEAIENIKKDPDAMAKIRSALQGNKK